MFALLGSAGAMAADSPFAGTWKMNTEKSKLTGDTMTFSAEPNGMMRYKDSAETYTFRTDGTPATTPMGSSITWKKADDKTYTSTVVRNGNTLSSDTWNLSDDGKKLTIESKGTKPNGDKFDNSAVYKRTAGTSGLAGSWVSIEIKLSSPNTLTFAPDGADGMTLTVSAIKATCAAKFDGTDYPATGPTVPEGFTLALTKLGPGSFKMVQKMKGKTLYLSTYTVSADGKMLTENGTNAEGTEPATVVYDKQ